MNKYLQEIHKAKTDMARTVVIDLDGVLTDFENCKVGCNYEGYPKTYKQLQRDKCPLREGAQEFINNLRKKGFKIIIHTSRIPEEGFVTVKWLWRNKIHYDRIRYNKPRGIIYIDDLAHEFKNFKEAEKEICNRSPSSQTS